MTDANPQLLVDLARLARRYPAEDWQKLLEALEDRGKRAQLSRLLRELAAASSARPSRSKTATSRTPRVRAALDRIRREDPVRADLLDEIWAKLRKRELLPTMSALRAFADAAGLKHLESAKREQAVTELLEGLVEMPSDDLEYRMRRTIVTDRKLGAEYERWVRLILERGSGEPKTPS
jgi:hypothetical protein